MNRCIRLAALLGCFFCLGILAGCPKPRTGPFDVPAATGSGAMVPGKAFRGSSDELNRAAAAIAAATVYFAFDRADIQPDARLEIERVAVLLKQYPSIRISLHGHCDERGPNEYNYGLGERRARAVYAQLLGVGAPSSQVEMVTYGKKTPAVTGRTESAYARNRRVEFVVLTTCF